MRVPLWKKFAEIIDNDKGYDNEKLARYLAKISEKHLKPKPLK